MSTSFKNLRCVLPQPKQPKKQKQTVTISDKDDKGCLAFVSSKARLLNRAKDYTLHLESVVSRLITELQTQNVNGASFEFVNFSSFFGRFKSIEDVRRSFVNDFDIEKSIFDYSFDYVAPTHDTDVKADKELTSKESVLEQATTSAYGNSMNNDGVFLDLLNNDLPDFDELELSMFSATNNIG